MAIYLILLTIMMLCFFQFNMWFAFGVLAYLALEFYMGYKIAEEEDQDV